MYQNYYKAYPLNLNYETQKSNYFNYLFIIKFNFFF